MSGKALPDSAPASAPGPASRKGAVFATVAFTWWGFFPIYFRLLPDARPFEVLANRIVWSLVLVLAVLAWRRRGWAWLLAVLRRPRELGAFFASSVLLAVNWVTYIWAVSSGHVVDASLGYFMTPLINVALGYGFLGERPRRTQWTALALATAGVVWLTVDTGRLPWIGLVLATSFGGYGLLRKVAALGALEGLTLETMILAPAAVVAMAIWWGGSPTSFPSNDPLVDLWLVGLGPATTIPLLLFAAGARRLPLTSLGLLQYLSPTVQFLIGVWLFREPFAPSQLVGFVAIWAALVIYSADGWRAARRLAAAA